MSKKLFLAPVLLLLLLLTSCEETTEVSKYDNWQSRNEAFTDSLYNVYTTQADHGGLDSIHLRMVIASRRHRRRLHAAERGRWTFR